MTAPPNTPRKPGLPPLRDIVRLFDLKAKKSLGQHFLLDENLTARIARQAGSLQEKNIIEIGPGPGGLTRALLEQGAKSVTAIEKDRRCIGALQHLVEAYPNRLRVIEADALNFDPSAVPRPRKIVSNLPYNIAVPLLIKWLSGIDAFEGLIIMLQKELAGRLGAAPGGKVYGRLSVITQWLCQVTVAFDVDRRAFTPPPKVASSIAVLTPRAEPLAPARWKELETVAAAAFNQRRKMLRASLKAMNFDFEALGIAPTARAEELDIAEFCSLARALEKSTGV